MGQCCYRSTGWLRWSLRCRRRFPARSSARSSARAGFSGTTKCSAAERSAWPRLSSTTHFCVKTDRGFDTGAACPTPWDLTKRIVWLSMWAAGMTPKNARRVQPLLRAPRSDNALDFRSRTTMVTNVERPVSQPTDIQLHRLLADYLTLANAQ